MKIAVAGLGLIGGSICKALKNNTNHYIIGIDIDKATVKAALEENAVDASGDSKSLGGADLTFICLHPEATLDFARQNKDKFKKGSIVADVCGVKRYIVSRMKNILSGNVRYVGTHPMAGKQFSGFDYSTSDMFSKASFIITADDDTDREAMEIIKKIAADIGCCHIEVTTPEIHDKNIAFTSQLAHVVSNAYMKSPAALNERGFSAGSFKDLTRVALLNESMWSELFMENRDYLCMEIEHIVNRLNEYKSAMENNDQTLLKKLLKDGSDIKKADMEKNRHE